MPQGEKSRRRLVARDEETADKDANSGENYRESASVEARRRSRLVINCLNELRSVYPIWKKAVSRLRRLVTGGNFHEGLGDRNSPEQMQNPGNMHQHVDFVLEKSFVRHDHVANRSFDLFRLGELNDGVGFFQSSLDLLLLDSSSDRRSRELSRKHHRDNRADEENQSKEEPAEPPSSQPSYIFIVDDRSEIRRNVKLEAERGERIAESWTKQSHEKRKA